MASNATKNYGLCQWVRTDKVLMDDFNADNAKIDTALAGKASVSAVNGLAASVSGLSTSLDSLKTTVNGKAEQSGLDSLAQTVAQNSAALSGKGNCLLYVTSYTGVGLSGAQSPVSLTFPKKPMVVFIFLTSSTPQLMLVQGNTYVRNDLLGDGAFNVTVSWSGNSVSWYTSNSAGQMNSNHSTYQVLALLQAD